MKNAPIENDSELWDLLGKAKPPEVSPFFARNVLREVRATRQKPTSIFDRILLLRKPAAALAAACATLMVGGVIFYSQIAAPTESGSALAAAQLAITEELVELEIILALDDLLALEENSLWLETF